jgi:hypothetical protein
MRRPPQQPQLQARQQQLQPPTPPPPPPAGKGSAAMKPRVPRWVPQRAHPSRAPPAASPSGCPALGTRGKGAGGTLSHGTWGWGHPFAPSPGPLCKPRLLQRPRASPGRSRAGTFLAWLVVRPHLGTRECMERCGDLLFHHATRVVFLLPSATIPQSPPNTHTHAPCIPPHPRCLDVCEALWQIPSRRSR